MFIPIYEIWNVAECYKGYDIIAQHMKVTACVHGCVTSLEVCQI